MITGVAFLGAGTIFKSAEGDPRGLTTAASLFFTAGIGVAASLSQWTLAVGGTLLALLVLWLVEKLSRSTVGAAE